jgi:outer membrane protein assembly factor BamD (BamD/ComL family)
MLHIARKKSEMATKRRPDFWVATFSMPPAVLLLLLSVGGCATFQSSKEPLASPEPLTAEQRAWWEANKQNARYVPQRGFYVEGVSGFFDEHGRPLASVSGRDGEFGDEKQDDRWISEAKIKRGAKKAVGRGPNETVARSAYAEGEKLFNEKRYHEAAKQFNKAYDRWPDSPLEEDALFMAGEAYFFADRYQPAEDAYALLIKKYPSTTRLDQVVSRRFAIGRYWELHHAANPHWPVTPNFTDKTRPWFDTGGHALKIYERIRLDDPNGPLADDATMATANYYFVNNRFEDADYFYTLLRTEFPKSEFQYHAHLFGLKAKMLKYQGPDYDGQPLKESEELAKQLVAQFPQELGADMDRIRTMQAEIRRESANRDFAMGEYYHKGKYYGASKMYFEQVAKNYPETELAKESLARLDNVKGEPDVPEDRFAWLTELFPESEKLGPSIANLPDADTKRR